jgi:hypothetical protein
LAFKEELKDELIKLNTQFQKEFNIKKSITRDYYRQNSDFSSQAYCKEYGSFSLFKQEILGESESELTRDTIDIKKDHSKKGDKRRYFVTGAIPNTPIDHKALESIKNYCKSNKAELIIFPMRGVSKFDDSFDEELLKLSDHFCTEFKFNSNLLAKDFKLRPQQINPLTGLGRFGQKEYSLIIPHTKQFLQTVPVSNSKFPHILYSTGVVTLPIYKDDRIGEIARQDHILGGLIIEIKDKDVFFVRQVQIDDKGGFYDLDKYYNQNKISKTPENQIRISFGDYHCYYHSKIAKGIYIDLANKLKAKEVLLHDFFNGTSISHWEDINITAQLNRPPEIDTLEKELDYCGKELIDLHKKLKYSDIILVRSNHDEWLDRYLSERRFFSDRFNYKIALKLSLHLLENKNPLQTYIEENHIKDKKVIWLQRDEDRYYNSIQIGAHGDLGDSGKKASVEALVNSYGKSTVGHFHTCRIYKDLWIVGTLCDKLSYERGPNKRVLSSCIHYPNGTRQMIILIEGEYCLR